MEITKIPVLPRLQSKVKRQIVCWLPKVERVICVRNHIVQGTKGSYLVPSPEELLSYGKQAQERHNVLILALALCVHSFRFFTHDL